MLHLIAEAASGYGEEEHNTLSTERLVTEMGLMNMMQASLPSTQKLQTIPVLHACAFSHGRSDSAAGRVKYPFYGKEKAQRVDENIFLQNDILHLVLSFLPWRCVLQVRGVNKKSLLLSLSFVTVCRLPHSDVPALFIPCHEDLMANEGRLEAELSPTRGLCDALRCGPLSVSPSADVRARESPSCNHQRMFVGQLRRDGTVPMIKWFLLTILQMPPESLVAVENHRNRASKRGKGCVWLTLRDRAASDVLSYHHRVFFDSVWNVEGVWLVPPSYEEQLFALASVRGNQAGRSKHLPRGTLVVEMPTSAVSPATTPVLLSPVSTAQTPVAPSPTSSLFPQRAFPSSKNRLKLRGSWRYNPYSFTSPISYIFPH
ncbi:hypothetical protein TraAM80_07686 [Trypanosoma rangeli]|uniref:Uncharacterized protein n=1 Tax=Trypanosoma rangeli TaxID=5698 RepID=A0A3R7K1S0_TRYRA|nr:uncharacterized protein TraAM80_07686 [Trypanosoma rangeli]RNF00286.1 hypothetical protein TraAM80_07686 [Trypanosoma rangeli]|eukprot:RNF00286.1 hypothetical protein TraAM80_07686 [Trypanosoma rangeli]